MEKLTLPPFKKQKSSSKTPQWLLSLENAGIKRDGRWLVRNISFKLYRGEIVTLIGPNGSGKSTTAKMALGIITPNAGNIKRQDGLIIGYVPQKLHIDSTLPLTVDRLMRITSKINRIDIHAALEETGVAHLAKANITDLSGGELQRVLLARAIARKPDILVLDEPLQGVDFQGESELYSLIASLREKLHCAILLISHDLHIVMAATNRVLCLNGHICCSGTPEDVAKSPIYNQLMGHKIGAQLALYHHHHDHEHSTGHNACENNPHSHPPSRDALKFSKLSKNADTQKIRKTPMHKNYKENKHV